MYKKIPYPKRYYIYLIVILVCSVLLIGNIYRTDSWTGDKPFSEFTQRDWQLLFIFLSEEIIIIGVMILFAVLGRKIVKTRDEQIAVQWEEYNKLFIKPGDYDYVWFDFGLFKRALILKQENLFKLYVKEYDEHTGDFEDIEGVSLYDSLEAVKRALFYEFDFYCDENTELDKHGDVVYKET